MAEIIKKKKKATIYTLCKHFEDLPEELRPALILTCQYCPVCGQRLYQEDKVLEDACSNCGEFLTKIGKLSIYYCAFCGEKFDRWE